MSLIGISPDDDKKGDKSKTDEENEEEKLP